MYIFSGRGGGWPSIYIYMEDGYLFISRYLFISEAKNNIVIALPKKNSINF